MAILGQNTDYTDRDFDSLRARLEQLLRSVFPDWTDYQVATFGNILMELYAWVGDNLGFYQNNQGRESRIALATQRKNLIALAKLINFIPINNIAGSTDLTITLAAPPIDDFNLPLGQVVRTANISNPIDFRLLAPITIAAAANPPTATVSVENAEPLDEDFTSTGLPNQAFELAETPYVDSSASIVAANGTYTQVVNFLQSTASDRDFVVVVDQNDRATIKFGNGVNGEIPTGTISVDYKIGGGVAGNVEVGDINTIEGSFTDDSANPVQVTITNALAVSDGLNRQSIEQIRQLAPEQNRVLNRTVAREDYEINAKRLPEIERALMLTSNEDTEIDENRGVLFVIPPGDPAGLASQGALDAALNQVTVVFPNTLTFQLETRVAIFLDINVSARVHKASGFTAATVRTNIETALTAFFALRNADDTVNTNVDFGFNIKDVDGNPAGEVGWSVLLAIVQATEGVAKIGDQVDDFALNGADDDVTIEPKEFPRLGTITLIDGDTGASF